MKIIMILIMLFSTAAKAEPYASTQVGGYVGFTSLGIGTSFFEDTYDTSVVLGYVPKFVGGEDLWSLTWKNNVKYTTLVGDVEYTPIYGGLNLILSFDKDTFWTLPSKYPRGYYPPSGVFFSPCVGTEVKFGKHGLFFEIATLDFYLEAYVRNPDYLTLQDISTYGIGYKYYLE